MTTLLFKPERYPLHSWARLQHPAGKWGKTIATLHWLLGEDA